MSEGYNPIIRTFCRLRKELMDNFGATRRQIRPTAALDSLVPLEKRRDFYQRLRRAGFHVPPPGLSAPVALLSTLVILVPTALIALWLQSWLASCLVVPLGFIVCRANRRWAVHLPARSTVGEIAFHSTALGDHVKDGGWYTRQDILRKVQFVLAESLNIDTEEIQREKTLRDLGAV